MGPKQQGGFTMIELVMVIVVLAILAVVATPHFMALSRDGRIATLEGVAGQLREQNKLVNMRSQLDDTAERSDCSGQCGGHPNWDPAGNAGYFFVRLADQSKLYIKYGYPFVTPSEDDHILKHFKAGMGLSDTEFVFSNKNYPLKIIPRQWADKKEAILRGTYQCHVEFRYATPDTLAAEVTVLGRDC